MFVHAVVLCQVILRKQITQGTLMHLWMRERLRESRKHNQSITYSTLDACHTKLHSRWRLRNAEFGMPNLSRPDVVPPVQKVEDGGRRPERVEHLSLRPGKRLFAHVDLHSNMQ